MDELTFPCVVKFKQLFIWKSPSCLGDGEGGGDNSGDLTLTGRVTLRRNNFYSHKHFTKCLSDFATVQKFSLSTIEEVLLQPIWNNAYDVLKNGKSIFDQKLGLVHLANIIFEEGKLLTFDRIKETFPYLSGMDYFQLISIF